jgi:hypothetical protein
VISSEEPWPQSLKHDRYSEGELPTSNGGGWKSKVVRFRTHPMRSGGSVIRGDQRQGVVQLEIVAFFTGIVPHSGQRSGVARRS